MTAGRRKMRWRVHDIEYDSHESLVAMLRKKS